MPDNNANNNLQDELQELRKRAMESLQNGRMKLDNFQPAPKAPKEDDNKDKKTEKKKPEPQGEVLTKKEPEKQAKDDKKKKEILTEKQGKDQSLLRENILSLKPESKPEPGEDDDPMTRQQSKAIEEAPKAGKDSRDKPRTPDPKPADTEQKDDGFEDEPEKTHINEPVIIGKTEPEVIQPQVCASSEPEEIPISPSPAPIPEPALEPVRIQPGDEELDSIFDNGPAEKGPEPVEIVTESELDEIFEDTGSQGEDSELDDIFGADPEDNNDAELDDIFDSEPDSKRAEQNNTPVQALAPAPIEKPAPVRPTEIKKNTSKHKGPHAITTRKVLYVDPEGRALSGFKLKDPGSGMEYELEAENLIGREAPSDIILDSRYVSGKHARLTQENGLFYLEDVGSKNGTFIGRRKISAKEQLTPGDKIKFGDKLLLFTASAADEQTGAAAPGTREKADISLVRKDTGEIYEVFNNMTIGRNPANDIVISEPDGHYVSSEHAIITVNGKDVRLKDTDSRNGTFVGNSRIKNKSIRKGNTIKIANIEFEVV